MPQQFQGAFGLAAAGRKGGGGCTLAFWGGSVATPLTTGREGSGGNGRAAAFLGSQRPRDGRVGGQQWARCGVVRMAVLRWHWWGGGGGGGRDMGVLRTLRGVGILGCAGQASGRGRRTMARWDYSAALLLQVAAWTTLQFWRLRVAETIALSFLKRALHSMPPFNAASHHNGGNHARVRRILRRQGWGECGLHGLGGTVRLRFSPGDGGAAGRVGAVPVWRRGGAAGGGGRRGPSGLGPGNDGKGSDNGGSAD